jgi:hypothetical protein
MPNPTIYIKNVLRHEALNTNRSYLAAPFLSMLDGKNRIGRVQDIVTHQLLKGSQGRQA